MSWIRRLLGRDFITSCRSNDDAHRELDRQVEEAEEDRHEAAQIRARAEEQASRLREHLRENNFGQRFKAAFAADDRRRGRHA